MESTPYAAPVGTPRSRILHTKGIAWMLYIRSTVAAMHRHTRGCAEPLVAIVRIEYNAVVPQDRENHARSVAGSQLARGLSRSLEGHVHCP